MDTKTLILGSNSSSRKALLEQSGIAFQVVLHTADESQVDTNLPFQEQALAIAELKMKHLILPEGKEGDVLFMLTADTLSQDSTGTILGKAKSLEEAYERLRKLKGISKTATGICLHKKEFCNGQWKTVETFTKAVVSEHLFIIPEHRIKDYFENSQALHCAGSISIDGYGAQYLQSLKGSYSAILGLPLSEVRQALEAMGFFA